MKVERVKMIASAGGCDHLPVHIPNTTLLEYYTSVHHLLLFIHTNNPNIRTWAIEP